MSTFKSKVPGFFITLEGGEGAGKTTQMHMLLRRIRALGPAVETTRQPGATVLGSRLRELLTQDTGEDPVPKAELFLYLADRAQHVARVIRPALEQGKVVVSDRFADSSEVYQGRVRGLGLERIQELNRWICGDIWPDITIVLDLDPRVGLSRVEARQGSLGLPLDRLESHDLEFHRKIRQGFLDQAKSEPGRIRVVSAMDSPEDVAEAVWAQVEPVLREWKTCAA